MNTETMKRILFILLAAVAVFSLTSCNEALPKRFDKFVDQVEKNADKFSEADWNKANEKFEKLVDEYKEKIDTYTSEEKKQVNAAIGKYIGLVTKSGINTAIDAVNNFLDQIPSLFEGIGGFLKGLGLEGEPKD
jgi:outer membrane protein assembly factor BamD (BamD/ComL family)